MKKMYLVLAMMIGLVSVNAQETYKGLPTGDSWVRSDNPDQKTGTTGNMQMQTYSEGITSYGVMSFEFTTPEEGKEVKSAVLRTMTRVFNGGDRTLKVYALPEYVDAENTTWNSLGDIAAILATDPIATISVAGQLGQNISKAGLNASMQTVAAWQNTIDLSAYVKTLTTNKFSILIAKVTNEDKSTQFYTKEATGLAWDASINEGAAISDDEVRPQLTVEYQETGAAQETYKGLPTGDGWVRSDNPDQKTGTTDNMQMQTYSEGITSCGVMSFEFTAPEEGQEVKSAVLRTMTRVFNGGDRTLKVYALPEYVDAENTTWNSLGDIAAILATDPIATISVAGQMGQNISKAGLNASMQTVAAWQNTIDLSAYVKTLTTNKFSILIAKVTDENKSSQFYTKEATGLKWDDSINEGAAIADADIQPQLTVTYKQTGGGSDPTPTPTSDLTKDDSKTIDGTNSYTEVYTVGSGTNTVTVTVEKTADKDGEAVATHGTVTATGEISGDNVNVTLTVTPENAKHALDGNIIVELIAGDSNGDGGDLQLAPRRAVSVGNFLTVTQNTDGTYSFTMASDASVIVTAKFKKLPAKPVVLPTVNYDADGNKVTIAMGTATSEQEPSVKMYYTTDGSDPRSSSTKVEATTATNIDVTAAITMVRVVSVDEEGNFSDVVDQAVSRRSFLTVSKEWVAFYSPATFTVPTGLKAYTISAVTAPADGTSGTVVLKEQTVIAKNTPMLIENTVVSTQTKFQITSTDDVDIPAADVCAEFKGTATGTTLTANGSTYYVLKNGVFLRANPGTVSAYNCYLEIAADPGSPSNAPKYSIEKGGNTTGIKDSIADQKNDDNAWYTLSGVRMEKPIQRGIYIHNGKKVVVK